ncbi:cytidine deaminase [Parabacteroides sp. 52]|uniref:cytidine deaminase n=1 Tax=unclassified Parabacteroides TaxID=2649774 RepID=UPI0013D0C15B|nr:MULTISPECIES: cytidine deaminase [unclassified Parabacteroides]MDH6534956.1 cytidine deaminase [Parabacteroides sp. PM5-20]NDV55666.1 cytidine deaminase [Parabacteroides sp. 52]
MKEVKIEISVSVRIVEELTTAEKALMDKAIEVARNAYAPYSRFHVGAALRLANGQIITGSNQENAASPSGLCAERVALFYAGAQYPDVPVCEIAIVALVNGVLQDHISPCGGCRQVLLETEERGKSPLRILLCGKDKVQTLSSANDLLPLSFGQNDLK